MRAFFDGAGAAGTFQPAVVVTSDSGHVVAKAIDTDVTVAAGASADVSFFPRLSRKKGAAPARINCMLLGSANGTDTLTITLTRNVPGPGLLQVVFAQVTIGDATDTGSVPTAASDSNAVPGWVVSTATMPLIGLVREFSPFVGPTDTAQIGSVARPCTLNDLTVGSTVTVNFSTLDPGSFHTAGLVIWQRAYWTTIWQGGSADYSNGDSYPTNGANPHELSWNIDPVGHPAAPDTDGVLIGAAGAYPAIAGFQPLQGALIGELATGAVSIAATCLACPELVAVDPGGIWPSDASMLMANYQFALPRCFSF